MAENSGRVQSFLIKYFFGQINKLKAKVYLIYIHIKHQISNLSSCSRLQMLTSKLVIKF